MLLCQVHSWCSNTVENGATVPILRMGTLTLSSLKLYIPPITIFGEEESQHNGQMIMTALFTQPGSPPETNRQWSRRGVRRYLTALRSRRNPYKVGTSQT